jgi:hypothetical protein
MKTKAFEQVWQSKLSTLAAQCAKTFFKEHPLERRIPLHDDWRDNESLARGFLENLHAQVMGKARREGLSEPDVALERALTFSNSRELEDWWHLSLLMKNAEDDPLAAQGVSGLPLVRINAPGWFRDKAFVRWLNHPGTATWHTGGSDPTEYSDVFFTFDSGDGSDAPVPGGHPSIPPHIWDRVVHIVELTLGYRSECLVWVSNLD